MAVWTSELTKFSRTWSPYLFGKLFYLLAGIEQVFSAVSHIEVSTGGKQQSLSLRRPKIGSRVIARCDNCFFVYLGLPDEAIPRHQRSSLALWLTLLGCTLLVAATATSQEVEPTPTSPEVEPTPKSPEAEPTPISPEAEPTTIPELEPAAPAVSSPETGAEGAPEPSEEVSEPVELLPTIEAGRWRTVAHRSAYSGEGYLR